MKVEQLSPKLRELIQYMCDLSPRDRYILCQRVNYRKKLWEVAEVLSLSINAVKKRENKIIRDIKDIIAEL